MTDWQQWERDHKLARAIGREARGESDVFPAAYRLTESSRPVNVGRGVLWAILGTLIALFPAAVASSIAVAIQGRDVEMWLFWSIFLLTLAVGGFLGFYWGSSPPEADVLLLPWAARPPAWRPPSPAPGRDAGTHGARRRAQSHSRACCRCSSRRLIQPSEKNQRGKRGRDVEQEAGDHRAPPCPVASSSPPCAR